jgi:hypothetical protein
MSYETAKKMFRDNRNRIDPKTEAIMYNTNNGLELLTEAIEQDMSEIKFLLSDIQSSLPD